jgi:hypothetical protein
MEPTRRPFIITWDPRAGDYVLASADACVARWPGDRPGILCGEEIYRRIGDAGFCNHHYHRILSAHAAIIREEDQEYGWSFEARQWDPDAAEVVYYIQRMSDGLIKVGVSAGFRRRWGELRAEHGTLRLLLTHRGDHEREQGLHREFRELRVTGEWFRPAAPLTTWILSVRQRQDDVIPSAPLPGTVVLGDVKALAKDGRRRSRSNASRG